MTDDLVSILIPCYNAEQWVADAVRSGLNQLHRNVEIIVVDDGSTDGSLSILESITDPRLKVVSQTNGGASSARNLAFSLCEGQWIQHLDADDFLSRDKISSQLERLKDAPEKCLGVSATMHFVDGNDPDEGILSDGWPAVDTDDPLDWLIQLYGPERGGMVQPGAWLVPRQVAESVGDWDVNIDPSPDNDGEYFCRVVLSSSGIRRAPHGMVYYRKFPKGSSMSGQRSADFQAGGLRSAELIEKHLLARTSVDQAKKALARRYKELAFNAFPYAPAVSARALEKATSLGFPEFSPQFPTRIGRFVSFVFGWRCARVLSVWKARVTARFSE